ncbi:hypothetical protein [Pseudovibrio sp. FO-BEG1]|uniref:hypothetical protein n=1 Tax=Pseudovibrio sp. (strain FO-BEG1) TaxID=911045 RepID=UPI0005A0AABC|nr:hypothetical protein [Pseudovibrio sp. FO-BEG1]
MDYWLVATVIYCALAIISLWSTLRAILAPVKLNPGGISFDKTGAFTDEGRRKLSEHYSRIQGTLGFWKRRAVAYTKFHYYCVYWTIISGWAVPLLGAVIPLESDTSSKWLLVAISSHVALALSFHRGLKVAEGMKAFRLGESEFYDTYRRLMDRPDSFGETEENQITKYFIEVERIRKFIRNAETETMPSISENAEAK